MSADEADRCERAAREREHAESLLDEALRETFPASDPIAVFIPSARKLESP